MIRAHMLDQTLHIPANGIDVPIPRANHTGILAIRRVALDRKALAEAKLARLEDFGFVTLLDDGDGCALPDHPEIVAGDVETQAAGGTFAAPAGRHGGREGLGGYVLEVEAVAAEEGVWGVDKGLRGAFWWGSDGALRAGGARVLRSVGGETSLLVLQRLEGALARRVGGCDELGHVGAG